MGHRSVIRYHFDLYPRDDPKDGTRLVRFTKLQSAEYRGEANGTGAGRLSLRADTADAGFIDPAGLQYVRVVREDTVAVTEAVVGGFFLDSGDFEALSERGTRLLSFGGAGTLSYLARSMMWSHVYFSTYPGIFSADDPIDGVYSADQMETTPRLGYIFWRWMIQATLFRSGTTPYTHRHFDGVQYTDIHEDDRTANPLPALSLGFDGDDDSDGNAWSNPFADFEVPVGEDMLSVARRCMEAGLYVSMDPDMFELDAWDTEDHRRTRTGASWGAAVVRFQAPTGGDISTGNIKSDARRAISAYIQRSVMLAGDGNTYRRSSTGAGDIPWEGYYSSQSDDDDFLERVAAVQLRARADAGDTVRLRIRLGTTPATGYYLPFEHIRLDDLVTVHTGSGQWDFNEQNFPVAALTIALRRGGDWDCWVDLGTSYSAAASKQFQAARVPSHNHPPNPRLCDPSTPCHSLTTDQMTVATATNGDLESGATNWSGGSASGTYYHGGTGGYAVTGAAAADVTYDFGSQSFEQGVRYVIDFWRRMTVDHDETIVTFGDEGGDEESTTYTGVVGSDDPALWEEVGTGADGQTWQRGRVCWTPSATRTSVRVRIQATSHGTSDFGFDDLALYTAPSGLAGTSPRAARCDHNHLHNSLEGRNSLDAHTATAVSIADAGGYFTSPHAEGALQELGAAASTPGVTSHDDLTERDVDGAHNQYAERGAGLGLLVDVVADAGSALDLDLAYTHHRITLTEACVITLPTFSAGGLLREFSLQLTGDFDVTIASEDGTVTFVGVDDLTADGNALRRLALDTTDGTNWTAKYRDSAPVAELVYLPLTTVVGGVPELVWDANHSLIPTGSIPS
jgi:hypothetical protein